MNEIATSTVRLSRHFDTSPERVFDAWFCAEGLWFFETQSGEHISLDRDGSSNCTCWIVTLRQSQGRRGTLTTMDRSLAKHVEIDRPRRLVIDLPEREDPPLRTRLTVEIAPASEGCELTLILEGIQSANRRQIEEMWEYSLQSLAKQPAEN